MLQNDNMCVTSVQFVKREKAAMNEICTDMQDGILVTSPVGDTRFAEAL